MKAVAALIILVALAAASHAGDGILDLTTLANYASQPVPAYVIKNNTPPGNAITDRAATLGRVLFYDKRLSRTDTVSCASCHQQSRAFGDTATASVGIAGTTGRHSMRLVNGRFATEARFFWDERAATLEAQTTQPIQDHVEMGFSGTGGDPAFGALVTKLTAIADYRVLFAMAFGDAAITETRVQLALAQFVRSIQSFDSRFDAGRAVAANNNAPFGNFTAQENSGKQLFLAGPPAGAGCQGCHRAPEFDIDPASRNNGLITTIAGGTDLTNTRSPSLRDLVGPGGQSNGGLMHDGSFATLARVIDHYNLIPGDNQNLDGRLRRPGGATQSLNLTQAQKNDLIAFLRTLTGTAIYADAKWSDPFDPQGLLALIVLPASAIAIEGQGDGTAIVRSRGAPQLPYLFQVSPNMTTWTTAATVTSSATGNLEQAITLGTRGFFRYAYQPPALAVPPPPLVTTGRTARTLIRASTNRR